MSEKRPRGRPMEKHPPPRTDATMDELAYAVFALPADHKWQYGKSTKSRCRACQRPVNYPEVLGSSGLCLGCS